MRKTTRQDEALIITDDQSSFYGGLTKSDIEAAKLREQLRTIERKGKLAAWNDYVGFGTSKVIGLAGSIVAGLELLDPNFLTINLKNPELVFGVSLAFLTGKSVLTLVAKMVRAVSGEK